MVHEPTYRAVELAETFDDQIAQVEALCKAYGNTIRKAVDKVTDNFIDAIALGELDNPAEVASQLSALRLNLRP